MKRRDFLYTIGAATAAASLKPRAARAFVPSHNWERHDFGPGPAVADRLYQGPFPQYLPEQVVPGSSVVMTTTPSSEIVPNYGMQVDGLQQIEPTLRAAALIVVARATVAAGRLEQAVPLLERALALARSANDATREANVLTQLANTERQQGRMSSDNQYTALGPTIVGFQTNGTNIDRGAEISGKSVGIKGNCMEAVPHTRGPRRVRGGEGAGHRGHLRRLAALLRRLRRHWRRMVFDVAIQRLERPAGCAALSHVRDVRHASPFDGHLDDPG